MMKVNTFDAVDLMIMKLANCQHAIMRTYTRYETMWPYLKNLAPWYPKIGPNNKNTNTHCPKKANKQNMKCTPVNSLTVLDNCLATTNCNKSLEFSEVGALTPI